MAAREFDVVVFGATSVTGKKTAAYLGERAREAEFTWAAAGRSREKLERTLASESAEAETIVAEIDDPDSLRAMAGRARVLLNLVGPYTRYATPVIEACADAGTHYVDLTGEIPFVRRTIERFDAVARESGAKIVQVSGFEALPPDLGVRLAAEAAKERFSEGLAEADLAVAVTATPPGLPRPTDFMSGGTMQSMAQLPHDPDAPLVVDPAALIEDPDAADAVRRVSPIKLRPRRRDGAVIGPMSPAAFINPAVIHRSAALAAQAAGDSFEPFRYLEGVAIQGPGVTLPLRYAAAGTLSAMQAGLGRGAQAKPAARKRIGNALERIFPSSGFGPRPDRLEQWRWRMDIAAATRSGSEVSVAIEAEGHPGYLATSRMLGEAGLLLAEDGATPEGAGCLTPAIALGTVSAPRFERAGLRFSVA